MLSLSRSYALSPSVLWVEKTAFFAPFLRPLFLSSLGGEDCFLCPDFTPLSSFVLWAGKTVLSLFRSYALSFFVLWVEKTMLSLFRSYALSSFVLWVVKIAFSDPILHPLFLRSLSREDRFLCPVCKSFLSLSFEQRKCSICPILTPRFALSFG